MATVELKALCKIYDGDVKAVDKASLSVKDKEFVILVGPSGCGKSTTLRMIAGLEEISDGELLIDDRLMNHVPPKDRDIAMVFQNYALYPHMTIYDNMAFGLKLRKIPKDAIDKRVHDAAEILSLTDYLHRKPKALSGGQRQRVAVGRAIVRNPKVFLFDEPLSNLDAKLRVQMRAELSKLHTRLEATMIYVTHDQVEAMTMGDRIVVMNDGVIQQVASPLELYNNPVNRFVAGFIGSPSMNFVSCELQEEEGDVFLVGSALKLRVLPEIIEKLKEKGYQKKKIVLGIRPENLYDRLFVPDAHPDTTIRATVEVIEPMGSETFLYLSVGENSFVAKVESHEQTRVNEELEIVVDMGKIHLFDPDDDSSILYESQFSKQKNS